MMNERMKFREKLAHVERLLYKNEYTDSATRCVIVIEQALRQVVSRHLERVDEEAKCKIQDVARRRNKWGEGIEGLTMGQLVHVLRESKFLEAVARALGKDLSSLQIIDLEKLTRLRNKFAHEGQEASRTEAEFLLHCLKIILETFELGGRTMTTSEFTEKTGDRPQSDIFEHGYALLIGVGNTVNYPKWSLSVTVKDVQAIHAVLIDADHCAYPNDEHHIRVLSDTSATRDVILDGLNWLSIQATADPEATVVVYYSGHGWLDKSTGQYYLIPHDVDPVDFPGSALPAEDFTNALREITAQRLLVFVDSCHAAGIATSKDLLELKLPPGFAKAALPTNLVDVLKQGKGRAVFTSSRGEQSSWVRPDHSMSIYTYHLIEALQGAGNRSGGTVVRVSNLMTHLGKAVPESADKFWQKEQTPFFDYATEDFPVALLRGGKGLPVGGWETVKRETAEQENTPKMSGATIIRQQAGDNAVQIGQARDVTIQKNEKS